MLGNSYVTIDQIITDAAQELRDEEFGRLGKPFYVSAAQRALTEMNYDTNFFKKEFVATIPENNIIELPSDLTEMDQAYLFSGDNCNISTSTILWIKPNMIHQGGTGYFAQNKGKNRDKLQWSFTRTETAPHRLYFAGLRNGRLYLSPSCRAAFEKVFIPYSGIGMDCFGSDFEIPMWAREAITDNVILRAAKAIQREDPQFMRMIVSDKTTERTSPQGSWMRAVIRYKRSDQKQRYDDAGYNFTFGST
ncbi:MAG TPA: hypothetical protein PKJ19_03510 [Flavobacteriales bacterium]|nr:hypothetical protein [Flavobacteriales bacterium]